MNNVYGEHLKLELYGTSHGPVVGMTLDGFPAGVPVEESELRALLSRRAPGQNTWSSQRREADVPLFLSGVTDGVTDGTRIRVEIANTDARPGDYPAVCDVPRPGHADYPATVKFGTDTDLSGGGKYSGRLTAPLAVAGALCLAYLKTRGIFVGAHLLRVGDVQDTAWTSASMTREEISAPAGFEFPTVSVQAGERMRKLIREAAADGDSVGGIIECAAVGLPAGLGDHPFLGVENRLAALLFAVPGVRGVEFGDGFDGVCNLRGSAFNDAYRTDGTHVYTKTNHAGGVLGGMTTGMPLCLRIAVKPTPSIAKEQESVSLSRMQNAVLSVRGRHDPCILPRALPVVEAAVAVGLVDLLLDENQIPKEHMI